MPRTVPARPPTTTNERDPNHDPRPEDGTPLGAPGIDAARLANVVVGQARDAIVVATLDGTVSGWNSGAERLYGIAAETALGKRFAHLIATCFQAPSSAESVAGELAATGTWHALVEQTILVGPLVNQRRLIDVVVTTLHDDTGRGAARVGINRDVTATARLEREFATLATLAAATSQQQSPEEIARTALGVLARATEADGGLIIGTEGERFDVVASAGLSPRTVALVEQIGHLAEPLARAVQDPSVVVTTSLEAAPFRDDVKASVAADDLNDLLFTGLRVAGRLVGLLGLAWREPPIVRPSDATMLQAAALVAAAVEHARLDGRLSRAFEAEQALTKGLQTLVRLTRLTASAHEEASFAELALAEITRTLDATAGLIARVDGDVLEPLAVRNLDPRLGDLWAGRAPSDRSFVRRLRDGEGPFIAPFEGTVTDASAAAARAAGYRTYAVVPVRTEEGVHQALVLLFAAPVDGLPIDARTLGAVERILEIAIANQRLRHAVTGSERRYRSLFEHSPVGLIVTNVDGSIAEANAAAEATYGFEPGTLAGRPMQSLSADDDAVVRERGEIVAAAGGGRFESHGRRRDGSTFPAEITVARFDVDGPGQFVLIIRDLSERRRLEDELVQAQKMEAIGQLVAGVAHELNNPLASIVGFSQLIRDDPDLPGNLRENAELLVAEADRTRHIVQNLLDFARRRPPERVPTRLRALVDNVVELSAYSLRGARIEVEVDVPSSLPSVPIDRPQLQQVLLNLTTNSIHAIRAASSSGRIVFRARALGNDTPLVRLSIEDNGPGIAPELRDRLFVPFFTTKPPGEGTGLGLSVSFGIVAAHGGRLSFEPAGGPRGAIFNVDLPAQPEAALAGILDDDIEDDDPPLVEGSPRVLVLDDEPAIRTYLRKALRGSGFDPIVVTSGPEAVAAVGDDDVAAILCDFRMPGMNGIEVFDALTAMRPALRSRFVFMSGDVLNPDLRSFAGARGIALLAKPFDLATVARVVGEAAVG